MVFIYSVAIRMILTVEIKNPQMPPNGICILKMNIKFILSTFYSDREHCFKILTKNWSKSTGFLVQFIFDYSVKEN